jgi:hypothetical protein
LRIDFRGDGGRLEHEVDQTLDIGRSLDEGREIVRAAHICRGIAGMVDGGDDEASIGERFGGIVMADE